MRNPGRRWRPLFHSAKSTQTDHFVKEFCMMKTVISLILAMAMLVAMTACGAAAEPTVSATTAPAAEAPVTEAPATEVSAAEAAQEFTVAIVQQLDHSSLDEIRTAAVAQLNALADEKGITLNIEYYNGQNDASTLNQIGAEVVGDEVDLILPIATLAALSMVTAAEGTDIPIVYAAISDPAAAGLTELPTVTGTSDALNTAFILDMMFAVQPDIQTVGLLYSNSETNSATPIAEAKEYLDSKGIAYLEKTGNTSGEIISAASSLVDRVDAVFTPTDNAVMATEAAVAEILTTAGIPHYAGADSFVQSGAFATCGVNYTELGTKTADMAFDILLGGEIPEYHVMEGGIITVNTDAAAAMGLDYSPFADMASTVVEVTTVE